MRHRRGLPERLKALGSNTSVAEMEISINNRKSVALLRKHGQSAIEEAQPEVKKWGCLRGAGLLWKVGGMERSVEGLQGLVCHCQPF